VTIATGEPAESTITTEPTRRSRIWRATESALASGVAVTTPEVMISANFTTRTLPAMNRGQQTPVVPLEAGAGPDNPPCPACGEPLFGWIDERPGLAGPVRRCESCGLGVAGGPGDAEEALRELDRLGEAGRAARIADRNGFAAWIGGAGWAGLERDARYLFTVESVRRLVAHRDQVVRSVRWSPGRSIAAMWQTLLNSATFGHNLVIGKPVKGAKDWQRRIDWLVIAVLAIPAFLFALCFELGGGASRRGSVIALEMELL
jgi:hypothetical protein